MHASSTLCPKFISSKLPELEFCGEHIVHQVVKVGSINEALSLEAWVHGHPAELAGVTGLSLHEGPHWLALDRYRLLPRDHEDLANLIQHHILVEELTCKTTVWTSVYWHLMRLGHLPMSPWESAVFWPVLCQYRSRCSVMNWILKLSSTSFRSTRTNGCL